MDFSSAPFVSTTRAKRNEMNSLVIKETRDHRTESLAAKESANQGVRGIEMSKYGSLEYWNERYAK